MNLARTVAAGVLLAAGLTCLPATGAHGASAATLAIDRIQTSVGVARPVTGHGHNPRHNIAPSPDFFDVCAERGHNSTRCIATVLSAIRHARAQEHMKRHAMTLPEGYRSLSVPEQAFVITDLERVDRGLRPVEGLTPKLNRSSHLAAVLRIDPTISVLVARLLGLTAYHSIWAEDLGPLASDYDWMYDDGYAGINGINRSCLTRGEKGCWGHRANILASFPASQVLSGGAGTSRPLGASIAEVLASGRIRPHFVYTWAQALAHGANGHRVSAR